MTSNINLWNTITMYRPSDVKMNVMRFNVPHITQMERFREGSTIILSRKWKEI